MISWNATKYFEAPSAWKIKEIRLERQAPWQASFQYGSALLGPLCAVLCQVMKEHVGGGTGTCFASDVVRECQASTHWRCLMRAWLKPLPAWTMPRPTCPPLRHLQKLHAICSALVNRIGQAGSLCHSAAVLPVEGQLPSHACSALISAIRSDVLVCDSAGKGVFKTCFWKLRAKVNMHHILACHQG